MDSTSDYKLDGTACTAKARFICIKSRKRFHNLYQLLKVSVIEYELTEHLNNLKFDFDFQYAQMDLIY